MDFCRLPSVGTWLNFIPKEKYEESKEQSMSALKQKSEVLDQQEPETVQEFSSAEREALVQHVQDVPQPPVQAALKPSVTPKSATPKSGMKSRLKGMRPQTLSVASEKSSVYRSDDGLRKFEDSVADCDKARPEDKAIAGTGESDFKPVFEHRAQNRFDETGISTELEECIEQLSYQLFGLPFSVSIAIPSIADTPLIGISDGFCKLSGYSRDEIVGQNCRMLLKGVPKDEISAEVRQEARRYCRAAHLRNLTSMAHTFLLQRNARKNGELFWNYFMLTMVPGPDKRTYIIGLQLDLGSTLEMPIGQDRPGEDILLTHKKHLEIVQGMMFGIAPSTPLAINDKGKEVMDAFLGLADDIIAWLKHAEERSEGFQKWGTRPWVAWPAASKHALLNGGTTLLRLEADKIAEGATAMTVFPVEAVAAFFTNQCSFKIRVDEVCEKWGRAVQQHARLPTLGFTTIAPAIMDSRGGLPMDIDATPESILLFGDGRARMSADLNKGTHWQSASPTPAAFAYEVKAEDILECIWSAGFIELKANGKLLFKVKDPSIVGPPLDRRVFGVLDCCYAACRVTLLA